MPRSIDPWRVTASDPESNNRGALGASSCPQGIVERGEHHWTAGLTLQRGSAYRCKVTRGPLVVDRRRTFTEIHPASGCAVEGRCQPKAVAHPFAGVDTRTNKTLENFREQAYVPAEQPSPSQGARFPPAHAHPRRSRHPLGTPPQGPQRAFGLTTDHGRAPSRTACFHGQLD